MEAASKELETKEYEATAGGGAVKVTVTGKKWNSQRLRFAPEVVDPEDVEMLSDLVMAAANEAIRAAAKEKRTNGTISGGLNIPGMF